jgi:tetratricopeptide (TPR) repeat protein
LPLALAQAAGYCEQSGLNLAEYLSAYRRRQPELLAKGQPVDYPATVGTTWQLSVDRLAGRSPAAVQLLRLAAFLAPDAIPLSLLAAAPQILPDELAAAVGDESALEAAVGALVSLSLVAREHGGLRLHRLVQAATRASLPTEQATRWAERAVQLVWTAFPSPPEDSRGWPQAAALLTHALAAAEHAEDLQAAAEATGALRNQVAVYLWKRAERSAAQEQLELAHRAIEAAVAITDRRTVAQNLANLSLGQRQGYLSVPPKQLEHALQAFERAVSITKSPEFSRAVADLGFVMRQRQLSAAREQLERALLEAGYGPDHPEVARILASLGNVLGAEHPEIPPGPAHGDGLP